MVGSGEPIDPGTLRRWLCDADLLPIVLGGASEILDVGRAQRCVTPGIRAALETRDGGCVFPGCDKPSRDCHAHHIKPWWAGGGTALPNLVLLCPHHHGIVEPSRGPDADRWQVRIADNVPEVLPPRRVDSHRAGARWCSWANVSLLAHGLHAGPAPPRGIEVLPERTRIRG